MTDPDTIDPDTIDAVVLDIDTIPTRPVVAFSRHDQLVRLLDIAAELGVYVQLRSSKYPGGDLEGVVLDWVDRHRARLGLTVEETTAVADRGRMRVVRVRRCGELVADVSAPVVMTSARSVRA